MSIDETKRNIIIQMEELQESLEELAEGLNFDESAAMECLQFGLPQLVEKYGESSNEVASVRLLLASNQ